MDATPALTLMTHAALNALEGQIEASGGHGETLVLEGEPLAVIKRVSRPMPLVPLPEDQ